MPTTGPPAAANSPDRVHHRREAGDRAGAQVVAVGEAAGDDDRVDAVRSCLAVPERARPRRRAARRAQLHVELAVRPREQHDPDREPLTTMHDLGVAPRSRGWRGAARTSRPPAARAAASSARVDHQADRLADVHLADVACSRAPGSARSTVAPCGSRIPGRCVTSTWRERA